MSAGLRASTVAPGRIAPEASVTVPPIACALARVGMRRRQTAAAASLKRSVRCDLDSFIEPPRPSGHVQTRNQPTTMAVLQNAAESHPDVCGVNIMVKYDVVAGYYSRSHEESNDTRFVAYQCVSRI